MFQCPEMSNFTLNNKWVLMSFEFFILTHILCDSFTLGSYEQMKFS